MDIKDVSNYFLTDVVTDAYSGAFLFNGKVSTDDASVSDSATGGRRVLTISAGSALPSRRVVSCECGIFIAGGSSLDTCSGVPLKKRVILQPVDGLVNLLTTAEALSDSVGLQIYSARVWRKQEKEQQVSSDLFNQYNFFVAASETGARNKLIKFDNIYYRVQNIEVTPAGIKSFVTSELEADVVTTVSYTPASGVYNPVTDTKAASASISIPMFLERYQTSYRYNTPSSVKFDAGDIMGTLRKTDVAAPETGDLVVSGTQAYSIISAVDDLQGSWEAHLRKV